MGYDLDYVDVALDDGLATVRLRSANDDTFVARKHPLHRELRDIFPLLGADTDVAGVVFAGGYDYFFPVPRLPQLAELLRSDPDAPRRLQEEARQIVEHIVDLDKPVVAAVSGSVAGMGAQIAFLADAVVASAETTFVDSHVPVGLASGDGATVVWPLALGIARARRHVLRGLPLPVAEAHALGLVETVVAEPAHVIPAATELARELVALPTAAYGATKRALNQWLKLGVTVSLELASALEVATYSSPEFLGLLDRYAPPAGEAAT
jgi:enoyl-CoA hydratase